MMKMRIPRPSPALALGFVALFVALAGTALALEDDSVKSRHIVNGAIRGADIRPESLSGGEVEDASIAEDDLGEDSVFGSELGDSAIADDHIGVAAVRARQLATLYEVEEAVAVAGSAEAHDSSYVVESTDATCGGSSQLIAGGADWVGGISNDELFIAEIDPNFATNTVHVEGGNDTGIDRTLKAIAVCLG